MRVLFIHIILLLILVLSALPVASQEVRLGFGYSYELAKKYELGFETELRNDFATFSDHSILGQAKLSYEPLKHFKLAVSARYLAGLEQSIDEIHEDSNDKLRFAGDLEYETKRFNNDIKLSNRFRAQYSVEQSKKGKLYFRNKMTVDYKISKHLAPFLAVEPYYDFKKKKLKKIRLYTGNEIKLFKKDCEFFLIHEVIKLSKSYTHNYILGLSIKL